MYAKLETHVVSACVVITAAAAIFVLIHPH